MAETTLWSTTARSAVWTAAFAMLLLRPFAARAEPLTVLADHSLDGVSEIVTDDTPPTKRLQMQVYLAPRHEKHLDRLLDAQQDPSSSQYLRWLSSEEYERRFGPTQRDVDEVTSWLVGQGFTVTFASASQARVAFEGTVGTARRAFHVRIASSRDGAYFANVGDPMVPTSLAAKISHVAGLHNLDASHMNTLIPEPYNNQLSAPHFGPTDVWIYHNETPLLDMAMDGAGTCIAALNGSDVDQESLALFNNFFGLPPLVLGQNFDVVYPDGPPGIAPPPPGSNGSEPYGEAMLDVQWAHGIAPGAQVVLYAGNYPALGTQGLVNTLIAATTDNRCPIISISWAQCGQTKSFFKMLDKSYKRGAAQGQTIFVATGDVGVAGPTNGKPGCQLPSRPNIEENAGSPNVTAVGATMIRSAQYDGAGVNVGVGVPAEEVWYFNIQNFLQSASTGGVSKVFKRPKFQKGIKSVKFKKRAVPDICLGGGVPAFPGYWTCLDFGLYQGLPAAGSTCTTSGGTSIVPPQYSGILAIIVQKIGRRGNINTQLYAMAKANLANPGAVGIRDVTVGNNGYAPLTGYNAGPGFDLASGWGSIDITAFVNAFVNAAAVRGDTP